MVKTELLCISPTPTVHGHPLVSLSAFPLCQPDFVCVCVCVFLGPLPWHMEGPRLGIKSEL